MLAAADNSAHHAVSIILLISVVAAVFVPWYCKWLKMPGYTRWALGLAILTTFIYLIYEASMPSKMIRIDIVIIVPVMLFVWINAILNLRDVSNAISIEEPPRSATSVDCDGKDKKVFHQLSARRALILAITIGIISLWQWFAGVTLCIILLFFLIPDLLRALMNKQMRHEFGHILLAIVIVLIGILVGLLVYRANA